MAEDQPEKDNLVFENNQNSQEYYEIKVQGQLDSLWAEWFEGMKLSDIENGESGVACTLVSGRVPDQSALHGLLIKIRDMNLKLLSVHRVLPGTKKIVEISLQSEQSEERDNSH